MADSPIFHIFAYCHLILVMIPMGLFDFFKRGRGYEVRSLKFCEVGKTGRRESMPENRLYNNARYVMPVARIVSHVDRKVKMTMRIAAPDGKRYAYDFEVALSPYGDRLVDLPRWGSEGRDRFTTPGIWKFGLFDEKDKLLVETSLIVVPAEELWEELRRLPEKDRTILHLYYYEDLNTEEIARLLDRNPATVRSQLSRARDKLKKLLLEEG